MEQAAAADRLTGDEEDEEEAGQEEPLGLVEQRPSTGAQLGHHLRHGTGKQ